jgi:ppGpp synthetase/RelA/SpoT-type nucleotidyltranferase
MKTKILSELSNIKQINNNLMKIIETKYISEKVLEEEIIVHNSKVEKELEKIFGKKGDLENWGDLFKSEKFNSDFSSFIIFSYKSILGTIPTKRNLTDSDIKDKRRFNLFAKGMRWSDEESSEKRRGDAFYQIFDSLNDIVGNNPINYLGSIAYNQNHPYFVISNKYNIDENHIFIPNILTLDGNGSSDILLFKDTVKDLLEKSRLSIADLNKYLIENIDTFRILQNAINSRNAYNDLFAQAYKDLKGKFKFSNDEFVSDFKKIILFYQFNDLPFDLHVFVGNCSTKNKNNRKVKLESEKNLAVLQLAISSGIKLNQDQIDFCSALSKELCRIPFIEDELLNKLKENTFNHLVWQLEYNKRVQSHEIFANSVISICKKLTELKEIKTANISYRIKEFKSFYNKLVSRANSDMNEIINIGNGKTIDYKRALLSPNIYCDAVFDEIRDLAGVRVICVYEKDVEILRTHFLELKKTKDLDFEDTDIKRYERCNVDISDPQYDKKAKHPDNTEKFNYRSIHITVKPGIKRKELFEYTDMLNVKCEIQIRSILSHGWSDVDHELKYKNKVSLERIDPKRFSDLESRLEDLSHVLKEQDVKINKIWSDFNDK